MQGGLRGNGETMHGQGEGGRVVRAPFAPDEELLLGGAGLRQRRGRVEEPVILFEDHEVKWASSVGTLRQNEAYKYKRTQVLGCGEHPYAQHIDGACCEAALAKLRGAEWVGVVDDLRILRGDVGHLQVRGTKWLTGGLMLHDTDPDDAPFVLVVMLQPFYWRYRLVGWAYGREGKEARWWNTVKLPRPAYLVPQEFLCPMATLP